MPYSSRCGRIAIHRMDITGMPAHRNEVSLHNLRVRSEAYRAPEGIRNKYSYIVRFQQEPIHLPKVPEEIPHGTSDRSS